ncbi:MAG: hypothetical protein EOO16_08235 [Chitinophagaceae bacterium]|nr:MAG: hypothetical protein EOO16_08235 [Chitinophagaceae bacterium]
MRLLYTLLLCLSVQFAWAQPRSGDASLDSRLARYMALTGEKDFKGLLEYIHPGLFKIAPREAIQKSFEEVFADPSMEIGFDSMAVRRFGAPFTTQGVEYRKVDYRMVLHLRFKDESVAKDPAFEKELVPALKAAFESDEVVFNKKTGTVVLKKNDVLYAIRDTPSSDWTFIGYKKQKQLVEAIFLPEAITHYKLL